MLLSTGPPKSLAQRLTCVFCISVDVLSEASATELYIRSSHGDPPFSFLFWHIRFNLDLELACKAGEAVDWMFVDPAG